jgi:lipid-A-disaccharide synthase-like uncharacterized protein
MIIADLSQGLWHGTIQKFASWWVALGLLGQLVFASRFVIQWLASERKGRSVIPVAFWYLSLGGSAILLVYAIHIADPVFILANTLNSFIYVRNLMLIEKEKRASRED